MHRYIIPIVLLCAFAVPAEGQMRTMQDVFKDRLPIYRGATPAIDDEEGVKTFLPLGEGESIDGNHYRFTAAWSAAPDPLQIVHGRSVFPSDIERESVDTPLNFRFRPLESVNLRPGEWDKPTAVLCFKFELQPIRLRPLESSAIAISEIVKQTAPAPEFLDPIIMQTMRMKILVNERTDGFNIECSNDGVNWSVIQGTFRTRRIPSSLLPSETFFVRVTNEGERIQNFSIDFEAVLETTGFHGAGQTVTTVKVERNYLGREETVYCPLAFQDEKGTLYLIIDNRGDEPLPLASSGRRTVYFGGRNNPLESGEAFGSMSSRMAWFGPAIPPKSFGVAKHSAGVSASQFPGEVEVSLGFSYGNLGFDLRLEAVKMEERHAGQ